MPLDWFSMLCTFIDLLETRTTSHNIKLCMSCRHREKGIFTWELIGLFTFLVLDIETRLGKECSREAFTVQIFSNI